MTWLTGTGSFGCTSSFCRVLNAWMVTGMDNGLNTLHRDSDDPLKLGRVSAARLNSLPGDWFSCELACLWISPWCLHFFGGP